MDDNYYLERRLKPPRFAYYEAARRIMIENNNNKKPVPGIITSDNIDEYMMVYDTITQDELDYNLKMKLKHTTPEQRYQDRKETYYFHELYRDDGKGCNNNTLEDAFQSVDIMLKLEELRTKS